MELIETGISGLKLFRMPYFEDHRGGFIEVFHAKKLSEICDRMTFLQDNESISRKHVLRGLHLQLPPHAQGKLVRVSKGAVLDVAVDLRKDSPHYGKHFSVVLSDSNKLQMWIPPCFAHGFLALEDDTHFMYKCTALYHKESEYSILWNDPDLQIDWGVDQVIISEKDKNAFAFKDFISPF
jgi:dTDP-4-dehydrorhamnose 3,5-epimerase